jgi:hypothetical protein
MLITDFWVAKTTNIKTIVSFLVIECCVSRENTGFPQMDVFLATLNSSAMFRVKSHILPSSSICHMGLPSNHTQDLIATVICFVTN